VPYRFRSIALAVSLAVSLGVTLVAVSAGGAQPDRATEIRARKAFASGHYDEAIDLFAQLYAETLHPVYLRNLGRAHQMAGHTTQALDFFRQYLRKGRSITAAERSEIEGYIAALEAQDGQPNRPPVQATDLPPERHDPMMMTTSPPARSGPTPMVRRWWFWTLLGAMALGAGAAALAASRPTTMPTCPANTTCQ
jgi:hypothetical protein